MSQCCDQDQRRLQLHASREWNGLDYVEVSDSQTELRAVFFGRLPEALRGKQALQYLRIAGGRRIRELRILQATAKLADDPSKDDYLLLQLSQYGDFSTYALELVDLPGIDQRYARAEFSFKAGCPSDLDCAASPPPPEPGLPPPLLNYMAKDYASFRQLLLDRLALLLPDWQERHVPDIGITLVEVLAYCADQLSYYQDAVATEAYLDTARQRISVRRHARLVDYRLHEGCNARVWLCFETDTDLTLPLDGAAFLTGLAGIADTNGVPAAGLRSGLPSGLLQRADLQGVPRSSYEWFEALRPQQSVALRRAHNAIQIYTWGGEFCSLVQGTTSATLLDSYGDDGQRVLQLQAGDVLIFEQVRGPQSGLEADADRSLRHVVRLVSVQENADPLLPLADGRAQPLLDVRWGALDALPFCLPLSSLGSAPACARLGPLALVRANVILADAGQTLNPEDLGRVPVRSSRSACLCEGQPDEITLLPGKFRPQLAQAPLTWGEALPGDACEHPLGNPGRHCMVCNGQANPDFNFISGCVLPASRFTQRDPRAALPQIMLDDSDGQQWAARPDLIASGARERHFVVECDSDARAQLRFGDGELGAQAAAGLGFTARYRVGNGVAGNVGADSITHLLLPQTLSGAQIAVRNPLPASGGTAPEPMLEAKLMAPHAFKQQIERAIIAEDYAQLAQRNPKLQRASAELVWTGSWNEAEVVPDPLGSEVADPALLQELDCFLQRYRRMGHDLHVKPARYVPLDIEITVCVLPGYQRAHVLAALQAVFGNRLLPDGRRGFFHPDNLSFGEGIYLSQLVALAQAQAGVECASVTRLQRQFEAPNQELQRGVLTLARHEIAQLDNDPDFPEHGKLAIQIHGGR